MTSIIKVDTIQTAAGGTPTASSLGISGTGKIGQVVQVTKTDSSTLSLATGTLTTLLTANITPTATSSKILVSYVLHVGQQTNQAFPYSTIRRNGTDIFRADAIGSRQRSTSSYGGFSDNASIQFSGVHTQEFLDSPNSSSQQTYTVNCGGYDGRTFYINIPNDNATAHASSTSTLTLIEVLA
jgi:hypothetical protein